MTERPIEDWRLQGQEKYLTGKRLVFRRYRQNAGNLEWDHDHCEFCYAKFTFDDDPDSLHEGYSTLDEYRWICPTCFADFSDRFKWVVVDAPVDT